MLALCLFAFGLSAQQITIKTEGNNSPAIVSSKAVIIVDSTETWQPVEAPPVRFELWEFSEALGFELDHHIDDQGTELLNVWYYDEATSERLFVVKVFIIRE